MILHAHATRINVGDDLLTVAVRALIRTAAGDHVPFSDFTNQPVPWEEEREGALAPLLLESQDGCLEIARAVKRAQAVVIGGGDLVANAPQYALLLRAAHAAGVPALALGIGVNLRGAPARVVNLWRETLPALTLAWAREEDSATRLTQLGVPPDRVATLPDLAYAFEPRRDAETPVGLASRYGIVSARSPEGNTEQWGEEYLSRLGSRLAEVAARHEIRWVFLPMVGTWQRGMGVTRIDDSAAYESLARHMPGGMEAHALDRPILPEEALALLRGAQVVVSMRLHTGILASIAGTPIVPISYSPKVSAWARSIEITSSRPDLAGAEELPARVDALLARRDEERQRLLAEAASRRAAVRGAVPALRAALDTPHGAGLGDAQVARALSFTPTLLDRARSAIRRVVSR